MIPFTDDELVKPVQNVLKSVLPMLERDGGGMDFRGVKNGKVYLTLTGACHGCAASGTTLKYGIERALKTEIHPELEVVNIPPNQEFDIDKL